MEYPLNATNDTKSQDAQRQTHKSGEITTSMPESTAMAGQVQDLPREFSVWSLGALIACLMATWEALSTVVAQALINGGAPCLFYNYIISFLGTLALASSMAEIASIYPTAGGQYHWVACLSPPSTRATASWFTGWISIGGQVVLTASAAFAAGLQLLSLVNLNNPGFVAQRWQGMLFYWFVLAYVLALNVWGARILPHVNMTAGVLHVVGFVVIVVVLGAMTEDKHTAEYVFTRVSNTSGWKSDAISWLVGLLSTVYPFLGYDAAAHMSEELHNPARYVPIAMVGSVAANGLFGFIYCLALLFCLGDLDELLATTTGFPFIQLFLNVTQSRAGASILSLLVSLMAVAGAFAGLTSTSRTAWAFARDSGMPYSTYFAHVDTNRQVPVRMCVLLTVLQALLGLIYVGNSTAFNAVLSMSILGMYASYALPIAYMLIYGRTPSTHHAVRFGPFKLGRFGVAVNIIALLWAALAMLFSMFPSFQPVTAQNMNYSSVVMFGWVICGGAYYYFSQRGLYKGPSDMLEGVELQYAAVDESPDSSIKVLP